MKIKYKKHLHSVQDSAEKYSMLPFFERSLPLTFNEIQYTMKCERYYQWSNKKIYRIVSELRSFLSENFLRTVFAPL